MRNLFKLLKKIYSYVIAIMLLVLHPACYAGPKGMVNILTRNNYLTVPEISSIVKNECGVQISYDEYYRGVECLKRISTLGDFYDYDIVIFPSNIYKLIKSKIKLKKSDLNKVVQEYDSVFKERYLLHNYHSNIAYFILSMSGFIWNPSIITLSAHDPIISIFKKAKNNVVILTAGLTGTWYLISNDKKLSPERIIQNADVYMIDGYNKLYDKDNFAFAFQRSGEAVSIIKQAKNKALTFFEHPKYSFISPDMIAELNTRPETQCVAKILASKRVLDVVQKHTYQLSPYGTYKSVNDINFQKVYKQLFDAIHKGKKIRWADSCIAKDIKGYLEIRNMGNKIHLLPQVIGNNSLSAKSINKNSMIKNQNIAP